jgi:CheY-like chemotaxis protein
MRKRILVVDDEPGITFMIKLVLEARGCYEVSEESHSIRVLERARTLKPDLIILDILMPELNGTEVAARLSEDPELRHIPFMFLSAVPRTTDEGDSTFEMDRVHYLAKPVDVIELVRCIELCDSAD